MKSHSEIDHFCSKCNNCFSNLIKTKLEKLKFETIDYSKLRFGLCFEDALYQCFPAVFAPTEPFTRKVLFKDPPPSGYHCRGKPLLITEES